MSQDDELLNTSTLRGLLLLGAVGIAGALAWMWWRRQRAGEAPQTGRTVSVPVAMTVAKTVAKKKKG